MKPLKRAEQQNAVINKSYYLERDMIMLSYRDDTFTLGEVFPDLEDGKLRVDLTQAKKIKVICDEYGHYTNVAEMQDGKEIYIEL